ncbi:MAG: FtsB family cell division protein [Rhodomicrobium sp.]
MRQVILLAVLLGLMGYVASEAVRGAHGLIANRQLHARVDALAGELAQLKAEHARLERDAALLKDKSTADPSLLDEQARSLLDLAHPADIVIVNGGK